MYSLLKIGFVVILVTFLLLGWFGQYLFGLGVKFYLEERLDARLSASDEVVVELALQSLARPVLMMKDIELTHEDWRLRARAFTLRTDFSALWHRDRSFMTLDLESPELSLIAHNWDRGRQKGYSLLSWLSFSSIHIRDGQLNFHDRHQQPVFSLYNMEGVVSYDKWNDRFGTELNFTYRERNFDADFSVSNLDKTPADIELTLRHRESQFSFRGHWYEADRRFQGKTHISHHEVDVHFHSGGRGKIFLVDGQPVVEAVLDHGHVVWRQMRIDQMRAVFRVGIQNIRIEEIAARLRPSGRLSGSFNLGREQWRGEMILRSEHLANELVELSESLGFSLSADQRNQLGEARLRMDFTGEGGGFESVKMDGEVGRSLVEFDAQYRKRRQEAEIARWYVSGRWQNDSAEQLGRQLGFPTIWIGEGKGKMLFLYRGDWRDDNRLKARLFLGDHYYGFLGDVINQPPPQEDFRGYFGDGWSFDGLVKFYARSGRMLWQQLGFPSMGKRDSSIRAEAELKANQNFGTLQQINAVYQKRKLRGEASLSFARDGWHVAADLGLNSLSTASFLPNEDLWMEQWTQYPERRPLWHQWLSRLSGKVRLRVNDLNVAGFRLRKAEVQFALLGKESAIDISRFRARWHRGKIAGRGQVAWILGEPPHFNLKISAKDLPSNRLVRKFFGRNFLSGGLNIRSDIRSQGFNVGQFIQNMDARGRLAMDRGRWIGFNALLLDDLLSQRQFFSFLDIVIPHVLSRGQTVFDRLEQRFFIEQGRLNPANLTLKGWRFNARVALHADLPKERMYAHFMFNLPSKPDYPPIRWTLSGSWHEPDQSFDALEFEKKYASVIQREGIHQIQQQGNEMLPPKLLDLLLVLSAQRKSHLRKRHPLNILPHTQPE